MSWPRWWRSLQQPIILQVYLLSLGTELLLSDYTSLNPPQGEPQFMTEHLSSNSQLILIVQRNFRREERGRFIESLIKSTELVILLNNDLKPNRYFFYKNLAQFGLLSYWISYNFGYQLGNIFQTVRKLKVLNELSIICISCIPCPECPNKCSISITSDKQRVYMTIMV